MSYYDLNNTIINHAEKNHLSNLTDLPAAKSTNFYDFNTAESTTGFDLIPNNTIAKVSLHIKRGGYNDPERGWTLGYATKSKISDAVYLNAEFTVIDEPYAKRKIWNNIGLYSEKNDNAWGKIGRSFIRSILNSAKGFTDKDGSDAAKEARKIESFAALDAVEFVAKIEIEEKDGTARNIIKAAIGPEHAEYNKLMQKGTTAAPIWA